MTKKPDAETIRDNGYAMFARMFEELGVPNALKPMSGQPYVGYREYPLPEITWRPIEPVGPHTETGQGHPLNETPHKCKVPNDR